MPSSPAAEPNVQAPPARLLLVGSSTRAAAESAARAGFIVTAIDAFADLDQHPSVQAMSLPGDFGVRPGARNGACAARSIACDAVAYLSNYENHPAAVNMLAEGRALWGNPPAVLRRIRNPSLVAQALARRAIATPAVRMTRDGKSDQRVAARPPGPQAIPDRRWLIKPLASGGGRRVRAWQPATPVPRDCYLQELVTGTPGSIVFVAASGRVVPIGMSLQLVGDPAFGSGGYGYCGNILVPAGDACFPDDAALLDAATAIASAVTEEFELVGVNGVDFVARDGVPHPVEVNPRWSASMELVERAYGLSVFGSHAEACTQGQLPVFDLARSRRDLGALGKAVVFARRAVTVGDTRAWLADASVRDVPRPGERIPAGQAVCTVFAEGRDAHACRQALVRRADLIYAELSAWEIVLRARREPMTAGTCR